MKLIAHRGNFEGIKKDRENSPQYIQEAVDNGFDVEIDVRLIENRWFLGHDQPQYEIKIEDYLATKFWLHCKNSKAFEELAKNYRKANFFWHQTDEYTMTSSGLIWAFPGSKRLYNSVVLFPKSKEEVHDVYGVCDNDFSKIKLWI